MDRTEVEFRRNEATEQVRSSFYALNVLVDTFIEVAKQYRDNPALADAVIALRYVSHELFNRITVMKMWDGMTPDADDARSIDTDKRRA